MAGGFSKIIVSGPQTNTAAAAFQTYTVSNVGAGNATAMTNAQYIPAGSYILPSTANVTIEINAYTGSANSWTTWYAANTAGWIESDGVNVRANATTGTQTVTLYGISGGQAVTGTFLT
jgi:hypothetical protein